MTRNKIIKWFLFIVFALAFIKYAYRYFPYKIEFYNAPQAVWAHRVNSIEKLDEALRYFEGLELDVVYNENLNILEVTHPPLPSNGLTLSKYIEAIPQNKSPNIWLDIKNLTLENNQAVLKLFDTIFKNHRWNLKNIYVESKNPLTLHLFHLKGYKTLYYLPYQLHLKSEEQLQKDLFIIKNNLNKQPYLAITADYRDYPILKTYFTNTPKYLWKTEGFSISGFKAIKNIKKDSTVKVILSRFMAFNGNP